jgi:hypothetical protein
VEEPTDHHLRQYAFGTFLVDKLTLKMSTIVGVQRCQKEEYPICHHVDERPVSDGEVHGDAHDDEGRIKVPQKRSRQTLHHRPQEGDKYPLDLGNRKRSSTLLGQDHQCHRILTLEGYANRLRVP